MNSDNSQKYKIALMILALILGSLWGLRVINLLEKIANK